MSVDRTSPSRPWAWATLTGSMLTPDSIAPIRKGSRGGTPIFKEWAFQCKTSYRPWRCVCNARGDRGGGMALALAQCRSFRWDCRLRCEVRDEGCSAPGFGCMVSPHANSSKGKRRAQPFFVNPSLSGRRLRSRIRAHSKTQSWRMRQSVCVRSEHVVLSWRR